MSLKKCFISTGCGHCKKAKPEYTAAAERFKDDHKVLFAAVDCTLHQPACKMYDVKGFPTFIYFNYLKNSRPYNGGRSVSLSNSVSIERLTMPSCIARN